MYNDKILTSVKIQLTSKQKNMLILYESCFWLD